MMNASSSHRVVEDEMGKALKLEQVQSFLMKPFFESCAIHPMKKNELNKYCVTCNQSLCHYCSSLTTHHQQHVILKIFRHCFKNVVTLEAMEEHIDCSEIQLYRCNKKWVIALEPLPHMGSVKWCEATLCKICKRKLVDPDLYHYCSITCKVQAVLRKPKDSVPPFISLVRNRSDETAAGANKQKQKMKRKRMPTKAPFS